MFPKGPSIAPAEGDHTPGNRNVGAVTYCVKLKLLTNTLNDMQVSDIFIGLG